MRRIIPLSMVLYGQPRTEWSLVDGIFMILSYIFQGQDHSRTGTFIRTV